VEKTASDDKNNAKTLCRLPAMPFADISEENRTVQGKIKRDFALI